MFWQASDGGGGAERLTTSDYHNVPTSFSPDGQLLVFVEVTPQTGRDIWVLRLSDRKAQPFLRTAYEETAATKTGVFDGAAWQAAQSAASGANVDQVLSSIEKQSSVYAELLHGWSEDDFRSAIEMLNRKASRGSFIVNLVLCAHAAYRTQLFST